MATVVSDCSRTQLGFVLGDNGDQLEGTACPAVAPVGRTEAGKMIVCCYRAAPAMVFRAVFWRLVALLTADLNLGFVDDVEENPAEVSVCQAVA